MTYQSYRINTSPSICKHPRFISPFAFLKFSKYSTKKDGCYNARVVSRIVTKMVSMIVAKAIVSRVIDCCVISIIIPIMVSWVVNGI